MKPLAKVYWLRVGLGILAALVCICFLVATGGIYTNQVFNSSVETGETAPQDWTQNGNSTMWSTEARTGTRSLEINVTNATAEWKGKVESVSEGSTYQVYGYFKGEVVKDQFSLAVRWFSDTEGLTLITESNFSISTGNYTQWSGIGGDIIAPEGTKSCAVVFEAVNGTGNLHGDDFEVRQTESWTKFMNGLSITLIIYLVSYYVIKSKFVNQVEKPQKLMTTGIGIYFMSWIVFWVLFYTLLAMLL